MVVVGGATMRRLSTAIASQRLEIKNRSLQEVMERFVKSIFRKGDNFNQVDRLAARRLGVIKSKKNQRNHNLLYKIRL